MPKNNLVRRGDFKKTYWRKVVEMFESHLDAYEESLYNPRSKKPDDWSQGYYFNERATLGFFALALSYAGAAAILQEFKTERGLEQGSSSGRCDLFAKFKKEDFYFEAKQCWLSITRKKFNLGDLTDCRKEAHGQLSTLKEARGSHKIAVSFIVPYQAEDSYEDDKNNINLLWEALKNRFSKKSSLLFRYLPKRGPAYWDGYYYPGVILLMEPYNNKLR